MKIKRLSILFFCWFVAMQLHQDVIGCSMYKFTAEGKTMVGCNHDAWLTTPVIWFETPTTPDEFGAAFTGARRVSGNRTTPQSGMNTAGLVFTRMTSYHPKKETPSNKREIKDECTYLTDILHSCSTLACVKSYIVQFDRTRFLNDIFIYIDASGSYLIVEPYTFIEGNDPSYVLANFCPSITSFEQASKIERYRKGVHFLGTHTATPSLEFCSRLSDTMHVCRARKGDGTLLTSIWDTKEKCVNLYFYHSFDSTLRFNLTKELSQGDHAYSIPKLFPPNREFQELTDYKTPFNTVELKFALVILSAFIAILTLIIGFYFLRLKFVGAGKLAFIKTLLNPLLIAFLAVLATNKPIFYFDAPYQHYSSLVITALAYTPFLLLLLVTPVLYYTFQYAYSKNTSRWLKITFLCNVFIYVMLPFLFAYWGFYDVWP